MATITKRQSTYILNVDGTVVLTAETYQEVTAWFETLGLTHSIVFA